MRRSLGLLAVVTALVAAPSASAAVPAKVSLAGPARIAAGSSASFTVTVKAGRGAVPKASLALLLSADAKRDARDQRLVSRSLKKLKARKSAKTSLRVTVPAATAARAYRVLACVTVAKKVTCGSRALTVTRAAAAPAPAPAPGPAPAPPTPLPSAPTPTPTPEPTPTATPAGNPPVVVEAAAPAPGPTDAAAAAPAAPALPAAETTSLLEATEFLYTGPGAVQTGVPAGTIKLQRAAVLRGRVTNRLGGGVGGVRVTVLDHPELGRTATRDDGGYDLAVNGGGPLTLVFERAGYIAAQRLVDVPWQEYAEVDPVVLVPYDPRGTRIDTGYGGVSAVRGSTVTDGSGTRTQTLLFLPGTSAQMEVGGQLQPLGSTFTVRSTEFTQGAGGVDAMPGQLPPTTAYTYAAEYSVDEAAAAGATAVHFSRSVISLLDNFLGLPVGTIVPTGWYDRERGQWIGAPNGRVVRVVTGGLDTDGDGAADNAGVSPEEAAEVVRLYPLGKELWRVPVDHFTPWDHNHPYGPAPGAKPPGPTIGPARLGGPNPTIGPADGPPQGPPCPGYGSVILCDDQILSEVLAVAGTDSSLVYRSDRVPGRTAERTLDIRLRGDEPIDGTLVAIDLTIGIAGRTIEHSISAAESAANPVFTWVWDGLDVYGRRIQGVQPATVDVGYRFKAVYQSPNTFRSSWARVSGQPLETNGARNDFTLTKTTRVNLAAFDARADGLGGWTLSDHHFYDPVSRTLRLGDGGFGTPPASRVGALRPVTGGGFDGPTAVVAAPDGSVLVADTRNQRIRRVAADGTVTVEAGSGGYGYRAADEGVLAATARLSSPQGLAATERELYIADTQANRIRRVGADGRIRTVAGGGTALGDDGPATSARLSGPAGVAIAPDGSLYIADTNQHRVRMVGTDGTITTVAGDGTPGFSGDGGPASAARLRAPSALALDAEGGLLVADAGNARVRRIGVDGRITTVAGGGRPVDGNGDGGPATGALLVEPTGLALGRAGELVIADAGAGRLRAVTAAGEIRTVGGGGTQARSPGSPVTGVALDGPTGVAVLGDQSLVFTEPADDLVNGVAEPLPGFALGDFVVPSEDRSQLYQFNANGRHLQTLDALTGATLRRFAYDGSGRLATVYDDAAGAAQPHAPLLTVDRSTPGTVVLRTRGGRATTLALDGAGFLDAVTNPAGERHELTHDASGLLTGEADPEGGTHVFAYDARGLLFRDTGPDGRVQTLTRQLSPTERTVTLTSNGGQVTRFNERLDGDARVRTVTGPSGARTVTRWSTDGSQRISFEDGSVLEQLLAPDAKYGLQTPYASVTRTTTPAGRVSTTTGTRAITMRDELRVQQLVETAVTDGKTSTRTFVARPGNAGGTQTARSPAGRTAVTEYDGYGRVTSLLPAGGAKPVVTAYDDANDGRVATITQGTRVRTYTYDARHRVTSQTTTGLPATTFTYDLADRMLTSTRDGQTWTYTYDDAGRRLTMLAPSGRLVGFAPTPGGLAGTMTLPGSGALARTFTLDGQQETQTLPSGARSTSGYDAGKSRFAGRTDTAAGGATAAQTAIGYVGASHLTARESWTAGAVTQHLDNEYDGRIPTKYTYSGAAEGTITLTPASTGAHVAAIGVAAGTGAARNYAITRDDDQLPTGYGPYAIGRDATTGLARTFTDAADATVVRSLDTEGYGELDERAVLDGANPAYTLDLDRDAAGRVTRRTETIAGGAAIVRAYEYDAHNRLAVVRDGAGAELERYAYDGDGNRTSATSEDHGSQTASYAAASGLQTAAGPLTMSFGADGFLQTRGGVSFSYGPSGELLSAGAIDYAYDAIGRLVRRSEGAERTTFLYGNPANVTEVTASVDAAGVLTTYFYDEHGHLHALDRGGTRYRVGSDQVGTPRVIVAGDGSVAGRVDRDSYGRVLARSGAVTIPIGFAGGIEDPDTGLVRFFQRDYDPQTGRWTARDPSYFVGSPHNLFAYADNAPASRRDPTGLWSFGGSAYFGFGGGITFSFEEGGFGVCLEFGAGLGAGAEIDANAKPQESRTIIAELAVSGPVGGQIGLERNAPCPPYDQGPVTVTIKGTVGPASVSAQSNNPQAGTTVGYGASAKVQGKLAQKECTKWATTWW